MNRKNIFISLCLLTLLAACSNDELEGGDNILLLLPDRVSLMSY